MEAGLFDLHMRWELENVKQEYYVDKTDYIPEGATWEPLPLDMFRLLFGFFGVGIVVSIPFFVAERLMIKKMKPIALMGRNLDLKIERLRH